MGSLSIFCLFLALHWLPATAAPDAPISPEELERKCPDGQQSMIVEEIDPDELIKKPTEDTCRRQIDKIVECHKTYVAEAKKTGGGAAGGAAELQESDDSAAAQKLATEQSGKGLAFFGKVADAIKSDQDAEEAEKYAKRLGKVFNRNQWATKFLSKIKPKQTGVVIKKVTSALQTVAKVATFVLGAVAVSRFGNVLEWAANLKSDNSPRVRQLLKCFDELSHYL